MPVSAGKFASLLLGWYEKNKRDLPWRRTPEPYRVWISEVMLQQTQVKTALPYFERFLNSYPTLESLARAKERDVLALWSGLGYYNRARNLHRAAQVVQEHHGGEFPREPEAALLLPGIGRYTAGAILSIAHGQALPILDGNISRFLSRYLKVESDAGPETDRLMWSLLESLVQKPRIARRISEFNQALMEIGSQICTPRSPECRACPLSGNCLALAAGLESDLPRPRKRRPAERFHYTVALVVRGKRYLITQNKTGTFLRGLWEFPRIDGPPGSGLEEAFRKAHNLDLEVREVYRPVEHQITYRKLSFHPVKVRLLAPPPRSFVWTPPCWKGYPVSSYVSKIVRNLDASEKPS